MDSAATPPAKRAAPRAVAKAKRLILPPGPDGEHESMIIDPVLRAKRPPRQPKAKQRSIDPLLPPPAPEPEPVVAPPGAPPIEPAPEPAAERAPEPPTEPAAEPPTEPPAAERAAEPPAQGLGESHDGPSPERPAVTDTSEGSAVAVVVGDEPLTDAVVVAEWEGPKARVAPPPTLPPTADPSVPAAPLILAPVVEPIVDDDGGQTQLFDDVEFATERSMRKLRQPVALTRRRPRVRRVTRVVRHVDSWSVFKIALVFNVFFYIVCLTSSVLLWEVAQSTGTVDNIERFFEGFGWETFTLNGGELYHNLWVGGLFLVVGCTGLAVLLATMFNLITDLVGGMRITVLEEEVLSRVKLTTLTPVDESAVPPAS